MKINEQNFNLNFRSIVLIICLLTLIQIRDRITNPNHLQQQVGVSIFVTGKDDKFNNLCP